MESTFYGYKVFKKSEKVLLLDRVTITYEKVLHLYQTMRTESETDVYIFAEIFSAVEAFENHGTSVKYHLIDLGVNTGCRGTHLTIETFPQRRDRSAKAVTIGLHDMLIMGVSNYSLTNLTAFQIAEVVAHTEERIVNNKFYGITPLFTQRPDHRFFRYGLEFKLSEILKPEVTPQMQ